MGKFYVIETAKDYDSLCEKVNQALDEGFELLGGVQSDPHGRGVVQTLVKDTSLSASDAYKDHLEELIARGRYRRNPPFTELDVMRKATDNLLNFD